VCCFYQFSLFYEVKMTEPPLPYPRKKKYAPGNAMAVAVLLRDATDPSFDGPSPANGVRCTQCNTKPRRRQQLNKIVIDPVADIGVMIGIDVCTHDHLGPALHQLLALERADNNPDKTARTQRLLNAIAALDC
jgi:hypothetical protein